jgi:hypothetical protein
LDFKDKVVLELGAGAGRLTMALHQLGLVEAARKYIIVEPSAGIERIRKLLNLSNVTFVKSDLRGLSSQIPAGSVDYFIAAGVIPHLDYESLQDIFAAIKPFLSPAGRLHANSSFYGYEKKGYLACKRVCRVMPFAVPVISAMIAAGQFMLCGMGISAARSFYIRNFLFSFQRGFIQVYRFMLEVLKIEPYRIFWGYGEYRDALAQNGLEIEKIFPHSIALIAKRREGAGAASVLVPPTGSVAVFGHDWSGRWFARSFGSRANIVASIEEATKFETIILAYDYSRGPPYYTVVRILSERGYALGRNLYLFQMLVGENNSSDGVSVPAKLQ